MTPRTRAACWFLLVGTIAGAATAGRAEQTRTAPAADIVNVTVKYAGKGAVDSTHRIWVWLFTTPDITAGSEPIAERSLEKNGATATFPNVGAKEVFIAIAYDEKGGFTGSAPPPNGSPVAFYGAKGPQDKPIAVVPGPKGSVTVTFTDLRRFQ